MQAAYLIPPFPRSTLWKVSSILILMLLLANQFQHSHFNYQNEEYSHFVQILLQFQTLETLAVANSYF